MFDSSINILVVDDMMSMRKIVIKSLREMGFSNFVEASDGLWAWEKLEEVKKGAVKIDFIVSDWNMPRLNGLDLLKKIRADVDLYDIPFLMVTAEAEKQAVLEAIREGVDNYIVKPFDTDTMKEKIEFIHQKRNE